MSSHLFWEKDLVSNIHFEVNTIVRQSTIANNAGKGRFVLEDVSEGRLISNAIRIQVNDYINLSTQDKETGNYFIVFKNYKDIDLLVEYFKLHSEIAKDEIKLKMSWFIHLLDDDLYIRSNSSFYNCSDDSNIVYKCEGDTVLQYACKNIAKLEELFIKCVDKKKYENKHKYYLNWCRDNNVTCCSYEEFQ